MDSFDPQDAASDEARVKYLPQDYDGDGKISERMKTELTNRKRSLKGSKLFPGQIGLDTAPDSVQVPICIYGRAWGRRTQVRRVPGSPPGKESRGLTCHSRIGSPCPRGGIPPGTVATRGGGVMFLHYTDQAFNAGDDGIVSGKSLCVRDIGASERTLRGEGFLGWLPGGPPTLGEFQDRQVDARDSAPRWQVHARHACMPTACALSL